MSKTIFKVQYVDFLNFAENNKKNFVFVNS